MSDPQETSPFAIVSLICGVLSVVCQVMGCCGVPMVGMIGIPLALVAIVLGILAMQQEGADKTIPGVGVAAGCATLLLQVVLLGCVGGLLGVYILGVIAAIVAGN